MVHTIQTILPEDDGQILEKHIVKKKEETYEDYMERDLYEKVTAKKRVQKIENSRVVKGKLTL